MAYIHLSFFSLLHAFAPGRRHIARRWLGIQEAEEVWGNEKQQSGDVPILDIGQSVVTESVARVQLQSDMCCHLVVCSVLPFNCCPPVASDAMPCRLVQIYERYRGIYCFTNRNIRYLRDYAWSHLRRLYFFFTVAELYVAWYQRTSQRWLSVRLTYLALPPLP